MSVISQNKRKITIYYHSDNSIGKQVYAYTNASDKKLLGVDISRTKVTGTQWAELANGLGIGIMDLINTDAPSFIQKHGKNKPVLEAHDWIKILVNEPQLLKYPVVLDGKNYLQIKSVAEFKKYIEPDSVGLEKEPLIKQFTDEGKS
ncbi:arsenate reductase family protein [Algibacter sp. L1A34]|uniref:arsenate reductase family protein n=1 Tax=Algibacter sp. L1A34 TaxID=2686365 RepID=UPI00131D5862|nr:ArsC/Spx/MgsR family protein [Algibacter sp. L1A34]